MIFATQIEVSRDAMVVDEEVQAGNDSEGGSPDVDGTDNAALGGNDGQDEDMREEEEEYQLIFHDGPGCDDDEDLEEEDNNGEGNKEDNDETNEGQPQCLTTATPTTDVFPKGIKASIGTTGGLSSKELAALNQSQPLEYLKAMLSRRESSSERSLSTSITSEDQASSKPLDEALLNIKENIFKGDLFLLLLANPSAPLSLKTLLNQVNLLEASPKVANVILELGIMIEQIVVDHKLLPQITEEIEKKVGVEPTAWDTATESTNKALEQEQTKEKNKAEIEDHDRDIAYWEAQIKELHAKISEARKRKGEILKFDDTSMAKELDFGLEFVEKV